MWARICLASLVLPAAGLQCVLVIGNKISAAWLTVPAIVLFVPWLAFMLFAAYIEYEMHLHRYAGDDEDNDDDGGANARVIDALCKAIRCRPHPDDPAICDTCPVCLERMDQQVQLDTLVQSEGRFKLFVSPPALSICPRCRHAAHTTCLCKAMFLTRDYDTNTCTCPLCKYEY